MASLLRAMVIAELDRKNAEMLARFARETDPAMPSRVAGVTAGGDRARLRGLPAVGRGVTGAVRGSVPHRDARSLRD